MKRFFGKLFIAGFAVGFLCNGRRGVWQKFNPDPAHEAKKRRH